MALRSGLHHVQASPLVANRWLPGRTVTIHCCLPKESRRGGFGSRWGVRNTGDGCALDTPTWRATPCSVSSDPTRTCLDTSQYIWLKVGEIITLTFHYYESNTGTVFLGNSTTCFDRAIVVVDFLPKKKHLNKLRNNANRRSFIEVELIRTRKSKSKGTKHNCFTACVQKLIQWSYWHYFVYFLFIFQLTCPKLPMCSL